MLLQPSNHEGNGSGERTKERKNASKDQGPAEVGLLADLLSKLRAAHKRGMVGIVSCQPVCLNGYMLTPRGKEGKDIDLRNSVANIKI